MTSQGRGFGVLSAGAGLDGRQMQAHVLVLDTMA